MSHRQKVQGHTKQLRKLKVHNWNPNEKAVKRPKRNAITPTIVNPPPPLLPAPPPPPLLPPLPPPPIFPPPLCFLTPTVSPVPPLHLIIPPPLPPLPPPPSPPLPPPSPPPPPHTH